MHLGALPSFISDSSQLCKAFVLELAFLFKSSKLLLNCPQDEGTSKRLTNSSVNIVIGHPDAAEVPGTGNLSTRKECRASR